ncbi:MAG: aldolase/citrate lyase family protein [Bacillota bacterium]|nr:aldolase/citrate lyase family protein [Bacillota bacterium]
MKLGVSVRLDDPAVVEIAGWLGYDFVWLDEENASYKRRAEMVRAAELAGVEPWFRVPANDPQVIASYLELGVRAVMIPHVDDAAQARRAADAARFGPAGRRNWFAAGRAARYGLVPTVELPAARNASTRLIVQIETPEAVRAVDQILAVPGVDMVCTGPGDLAQCLGLTGQVRHPAVLAAEETVFAAAERAKKGVLYFASSAAELQALRTRWNVEYVMTGTDTGLVLGAMRERLAEMRGASG